MRHLLAYKILTQIKSYLSVAEALLIPLFVTAYLCISKCLRKNCMINDNITEVNF